MMAAFMWLLAFLSLTTLAHSQKTLTWVVGAAYPPESVPMGGTLTLNWAGLHGVYKIPSAKCPARFVPRPPNQVELAEEVPGGKYTYTCKEPGTTYLACQVADHCAEGQKVEVTCA